MSGFPTGKVVKFVRKNAIALFIGYGLFCAASLQMSNASTYKKIYSKNDYERKTHLEAIEKYISNGGKI